MAINFSNGTTLSTGSTGKILQIVHAHKSDRQTFSTSSGTYSDVSGMSATITPSSTSNKIIIMFNINTGGQSGQRITYRLQRNGTNIARGDADSSSQRGCFSSIVTSGNSQSEHQSYVFRDSPSSTSALTYKIQFESEGGTHIINNTRGGDGGSTYHVGSSNIMLMEEQG
tara:strand:+ start:51 stop:560 length:510 start_codon:yes stop_codon:yes gene_type:complete